MKHTVYSWPMSWPPRYTDQQNVFLALKGLTTRVGNRMANGAAVTGVSKQMWVGFLSCHPSLSSPQQMILPSPDLHLLLLLSCGMGVRTSSWQEP